MMRKQKLQLNGWTSGMVAVGIVGLTSAARAEETQHSVLTTLSSTTLSGYVDTSAIVAFGHAGYVSSPGATPTYHTTGRSFDGDAKQNGFNLNVVKLQLEKPLDEAQWSAGYKVGVLFGPDANTFASTSTGTANATSDFAIKNAYVALRAPVGNGLDFKIGTFDTMMGYEVFEAGANPNYSRSYGFYLEPLIHTGIMTTYKFCEVFSASAGVVDPNNPLVNPNQINARTTGNVLSYMGSLTLTAPENAGFLKGAAITASIMDHAVAGEPNTIEYYIGGSMPTPVKGLSLGIAYDYRGNDASDTVSSRYANAISGYLVLQAAEKLKLAGRIEYASGTSGTYGYASKPGTNNELLGVTATVDYSLWANVVSRVEFRWDQDLSNTGVFGDGTAKNALSLALNVIYNF